MQQTHTLNLFDYIAANAAQRAALPKGPVLGPYLYFVLYRVQVQVLYSYFRVPVPVHVPYGYSRASSFNVYFFQSKHALYYELQSYYEVIK